MSVPTVAWDETSPPGTQAISLGDDRIREMKTQLRQLIGVDHDFPSSGSSADNGQHLQVTLQEQADLGTGAVGATLLGSQTVAGKGELMYTDEDDNDIQITSGGVLLVGTLANDTWFTATDNAGTGTVNLIKANTSDALVVADGAVLETSGAPTTDPMISNKKYVDDTVATHKYVKQEVNYNRQDEVACATAIPLNDSTRTNAEGNLALTLAITPTDATSILRIDIVINGSGSAASHPCAILMEGTTVISTGRSFCNSSGAFSPIIFTDWVVAASTTLRTYNVNVGANTGTFTVNGASVDNGALISSITITELLP